MRKTALIAVGFALFVAAANASTNHVWTKTFIQDVGNSQLLCHWRCNGQGHGHTHFASTRPRKG